MAFLDRFYDAVDVLSEKFIERLSEAVSIPSISCSALHRKYVIEMADFLYKEMKNLNIDKLNSHLLLLENMVMIRIRKIHFDVQPALISDGWITDPWEFKYDEETGRMYGRGISDDKGPVLGWLNTVEAFQNAGIDLPVNLVFCFEGMEENGSVGLDEFVKAEAQKYFADVDYVCISDNYWLGTKKPCLTYGLRGISCYSVTIKGPNADLHSGVFGGIIHEPMTDLIHLFSSLVKPDGTILIPGIMDQVELLSEKENALYDGISITMEDIYHSAGSKTTIYDKEKCILMHRWRYPSLSLHGIEGAFSLPGIKTVIPSKVSGKFSIRLVPNMNPEDVCILVKKHLESVFLSLGSKNTLIVDYLHGSKAWVSSPDHPNYKAAEKATKKIYGVVPDFTREGGSIPVALTFEDCLNKNVLLLPMGRGDDGAHSINEKLDKSNFIQGTKLFGTYLYEISIS
ncbi:metallodipeptidase [Pneumocystis jirovecii RU7]|uniref:Peptidase M20 dimerisation domain-containing protein n=1 Tax=Pneumocystis jirovecii (strain RU7) TaxID=1408657 RepID=A0A0W4ZK37_PNEJ7|nr:metallodipeptidase [Pneumocystis jirovecii RU7]KTW28739.1 hypothetical protein T551_02589 [Pneumocystis jirovecii RU7]